jgi:hypothetical protein
MKKDLVILVADMDAEMCLKSLLPRFQIVLGTREITFDIFKHSQRDGGCRTESHNFLRGMIKNYDYAMVIFDYEGSGSHKSVENSEKEVKELLEKNGWKNKCEVIIANPEIDNWIWANSPHVATHLGWQNLDELNLFLVKENFKKDAKSKPERPKEAMEIALKSKKEIPHTSAIFKNIANDVSFKSCTDKSFLKFKDKIVEWFNINSTPTVE